MNAKKMVIRMAKSFQHNKEHYFEKKIYGETVHICPRCLGKWIAIYVTLPILSLLFFMNMIPKFDIIPVFVGCWILALACVVDWASARVFHLWTGNNRMRFFTGILLGTASTMYIFLMPTNIILNLLSLIIFTYSFDLLIFKYQCRDRGITLKEGLSNKMRSMLVQSIESQEKLFKKFPMGTKATVFLSGCIPSCEQGPSGGCGCPCACDCTSGCCGGGGACSACGGSGILIIGLVLLVLFLLITGIAGKSGCGEDDGCCGCGCCGDCGCCGSGEKEGSTGGCCGGSDKGDSGRHAKRGSGSLSEKYANGDVDENGWYAK